jgi:hypothetical protein
VVLSFDNIDHEPLMRAVCKHASLDKPTNSQQCFKPVPELFGQINQQSQG